MSRKIPLDSIQIEKIHTAFHEELSIIRIEWNSNQGFGQYDITYNKLTSELTGDSECMDNNEDKEFLKKLFSLIIEKIQIK